MQPTPEYQRTVAKDEIKWKEDKKRVHSSLIILPRSPFCSWRIKRQNQRCAGNKAEKERRKKERSFRTASLSLSSSFSLQIRSSALDSKEPIDPSLLPTRESPSCKETMLHNFSLVNTLSMQVNEWS